DQELNIVMTPLSFEQRREFLKFGQREMRAAENDQVELLPDCSRQFAPRLPQTIHRYDDCLSRRFLLECGFDREGFGRDSYDVNHGGRPRGGSRRAKSFELICGWDVFNSFDDGNAILRDFADQVSQHWVDLVVFLSA